MNRLAAIVVAAALLTGAVPAAATLATQTPSDGSTAPGASFASVVGVQQAEVGNEVASRALEQRLAAANTDASKAGVVASETERLEQRLTELEREKASLEAAYENGSINRGEYQAKLARLGAEIKSVERQADRTADAADGVSEEALREKGVNASEARSVAQRANESSDGEVAEATASVGNGVGNGLADAPGQSGERGRSNGTGTATDGTDATTQPTDRRNGQNSNTTVPPRNGSDIPNGSQPTDVQNRSDQVGNGTPGGPGNGSAIDGTETVTPTANDTETATANDTETATATTTETATANDTETTTTETAAFGAVFVH